MFNFLDSYKQEYIYNLIRQKILPNLDISEYKQLVNLLNNLIEYITIKLAIDPKNYESFWNQLKQNNNRDIIGLFNLLLPFIDDKKSTYELHNKIYFISDISNKKINTNSKSSNSYVISNIQYNLYDEEKNEEVSFTFKNIQTNYELLLQTIDLISNKFYVNWLNIIPLTLSNYKKSHLYENSLTYHENPHNDLSSTFNNKSIDPNIEDIPFTFKASFFAPKNDDNENYINEVSEIYDKTLQLNFDIMCKNKGISFNDIFNTIYYDLFYDVVKIKWLIYQDTFDDPNNDEIYIKKFNELISINGMYYGEIWDELDFSEQEKFISKWKSFLGTVTKNTSKNRNSYFHLLLSIITFMEKNYNRIDYIIKEFDYVKISTDNEFDYIDDDDGQKESLEKIGLDEYVIIERIKKIPYEDLYDYLMTTIQQFIITWYGKKIIKINGNKISFNYESCINEFVDKNYIKTITNEIVPLPENLTVKYKFFYNFAKSFVIIYEDDKSYKRQPWFSLLQEERKILLSFLNMNYHQIFVYNTNIDKDPNFDVASRFNVMSFMNYYKRTYTNSEINFHNTNPIKDLYDIGYYIGNIMFELIKKQLIDIVFECTIYKGLLTEFITNPYLTDVSYLGSNYQMIKKNRYKNIEKYLLTPNNLGDFKKNAYYFLTEKKYGDHSEIYINGKKKSFFDLIKSEYAWTSFYSMDWISQICFFHKYINNRVIYITGATGQGKSTQTPKLFLYALKMIDKKSNGKIICSQPRIAPTRDNSEYISWEMGVPISEESQNYKKKIKTFNPNIQYKTQFDSFIVEHHNGLLLKMVTDRILYSNLLQKPLFKETVKTYNQNETSNAIEFNIFTDENLYDIIMVDESHEHNVNMDLILTMARDTVKYNNSLKLVIVSATMADDELIYRRYFKEIDDNFLYPYNFFNCRFNLDRYYVDRRIDISPPGETTRYKVTENYLSSEPNNYDESEILGLKQVMSIATDPNSSGDILFFSVKVSDIEKIYKYINANLPASSKFICLPFYRELPNRWNIFNNLSRKIKEITINREDIYLDINPDISNQPRKVPAGTYERAIIVATNIAEASITIDSLKYVIDTGYYLSVANDPYENKTLIQTKKISDPSRIQRKGRVGRVSSGTVYYMYKENSRKDIKPEFKICTTDLSDELYDLTANSPFENNLISCYTWHEVINNQVSEEDIEKIRKVNKYLIDSKIFKNIIIPQYTYRNYFMPSIINFIARTSVSNITIKEIQDQLFQYNFNIQKTYNIITKRSQRKITGYHVRENIYDTKGTFYIIHPEEDNISRNILTGEILHIKKRSGRILDNSLVVSGKINNFLKKCFNKSLFIDLKLNQLSDSVFESNNFNVFADTYLLYEKSIVGRIISNMLINFNILDNDKEMMRNLMLTLVHSYLCGLDDKVIVMIALLHFSGFQLDGLNKNYSIFKYKCNNDIDVYYKLSVEIYKKLQSICYTNKSNLIDKFNRDKELFIKQKNKIFNDIKNNSNYWKLDINFELYEKFNKLYNQKKLNKDRDIIDLISEDSKNINIDMINKIQDLLKSCSITFETSKIIKFIEYYINIKNQFDKLKNIYNIAHNTNDLLWFKYNLPVNLSVNEFDNIVKSFIFGFCFNNTIIYDNSRNIYVDINYLKNYNLHKSSITKPSQLMLYLYENRNISSILINVNLDDIVKYSLYNFNPMIKYVRIGTNNSDQYIRDKIYNMLVSISKNKYKYINYVKTIMINPEIDNKKLFKDLFSYNNNFSNYLVQLWTGEGSLDQIGGGKSYKINVTKLDHVLKKMKINYSQFIDLLHNLSNEYDIYVYNSSIVMNQKLNQTNSCDL